MVLGAYYLTLVKPAAKGEGKIFSNYDEVMLAYDAKVIDIEALIKVRIPGHGLIETTAGKLLYNYQIYEPLRLFHTDKVMVFTDPKDTVFAYENGLIDWSHFVKIKDEEGHIRDYGFSQLKENSVSTSRLRAPCRSVRSTKPLWLNSRKIKNMSTSTAWASS